MSVNHAATSSKRKVMPLLGVAGLLIVTSGCAVDKPRTAGQSSRQLPAAIDVEAKTVPLTKFAQPPQLNIKASVGDTCRSQFGPPGGRPLHQPQKIQANAQNILETELVVRIKQRCVPAWHITQEKDEENNLPELGIWQWKVLDLRTYGFPKDHNQTIDPGDENDDNIAWSAPGPTFVLNAGNSARGGSRFKMTLHNRMPQQTSANPDEDPYNTCDPLKNDVTNPHYISPNCFHGNNVTNFHFHGFHISPQAHQDYVLLSLFPEGASADSYSAHGDSAVGSYDYDVPSLPDNQAPGTHWYHAHKHGATALQVLNGLVGTFEVRGEFDEQLNAFFNQQAKTTTLLPGQNYLEDNLMVVQQLQQNLSAIDGNETGTRPKYPLINGQASPVITMRPGEIQRWRFVGATMQASAQLKIGFEEEANGAMADPQVRQIEMDGVQFAAQNYQCQPLLRGPDCIVSGDEKLDDFTLNPGNRIDVLIKAPDTIGTHHMTFEIVGRLNKKQRTAVTRQAKSMIGQLTFPIPVENPPLLTLVVKGAPKPMRFPDEAEFPPLPAFLDDLTVSDEGSDTTLVYQMTGQATPEDIQFSINDRRYSPHCVNESFTLKVPEQWQLENNSGIAHPFHIHTNPFQLISQTSYDESGYPQKIQYNPPYIWQDTLAIPVASVVGDKPNGQALIRYEGVDFTGAFVNHCHILGHEDRGMMQNVQVLCPNGQWGKPTMDGSPECKTGNYSPAPLPTCP